MKTKARYIHVAGVLKGLTRDGMPICRNTSMKTRCASRIASPFFGMMGENHRCPSDGDGLSGDLAPMEKIAMFGTPIATLCTRSSCSGVSGNCSSGPSVNAAPGIVRNRAFAYSICVAITLAGPYHWSSQRQ